MKAFTVILTALTAACTLFLLTGCVTNVNLHADSGNYTSGDFSTEHEVKALEIDWASGTVTVSAAEQSAVTVTETCNAELKDNQKMQTWLDGTTLHIRYCKPGVNFNFRDAEKNLEVVIPKRLLETLKYDGTSASAVFNEISAGSFQADSTSGNLLLNGCTADRFDLETTSGSITAEQKDKSDSLEAESTSGSITLRADEIKTLKISSTSGDADISTQLTESVKITGTAGKRLLTFANMPKETVVSSTSGDISLTIPKNAEFTASVDTTTGDFSSDISLAKRNNQYVSGSGADSLRIDTTSGNVDIIAAE